MIVRIELPHADVIVIVTKALGKVVEAPRSLTIVPQGTDYWVISDHLEARGMPEGAVSTSCSGGRISQTINGNGNIVAGSGTIAVIRPTSCTIRIGTPDSVVLKGVCHQLHLIRDTKAPVTLELIGLDGAVTTEI